MSFKLPNHELLTNSILSAYSGDARQCTLATDVSWVNWRDGFQVKVKYEPMKTSMVDHYYVGFYFCFSEFPMRQTLLSKLCSHYGKSPRVVDSHTRYSYRDYSFKVAGIQALADMLDVAEKHGVIPESIIINMDGSSNARKHFDEFGMPLGGHTGWELFPNGNVIPYSTPTGFCL